MRNAFGAHFVEVEVDTELGRVRVTKYVAVHDCGRIMNPLTATSQIKGGASWASAWRCTRTCSTTGAAGSRSTPGYYGARIATHRDAPEIEVIFIETDDGYGPFGAKSIGESGKILAPAAVANAVFNAIGRRMKDLPITRDKICWERWHEDLHQRERRATCSTRSTLAAAGARERPRGRVRRRRQRSARHWSRIASSRPTCSST